MLSIRWSMCDIGKKSLGQISFRSVMRTAFDTHCGWSAYLMRSLSTNFFTSSASAAYFSGLNFLHFWVIALFSGSMFSLWQGTSELMPTMSLFKQVKISNLHLKKLMSSLRSLKETLEPIIVSKSGWTGSIEIFLSSSSSVARGCFPFGSSIAPWIINSLGSHLSLDSRSRSFHTSDRGSSSTYIGSSCYIYLVLREIKSGI